MVVMDMYKYIVQANMQKQGFRINFVEKFKKKWLS